MILEYVSRRLDADDLINISASNIFPYNAFAYNISAKLSDCVLAL